QATALGNANSVQVPAWASLGRQPLNREAWRLRTRDFPYIDEQIRPFRLPAHTADGGTSTVHGEPMRWPSWLPPISNPQGLLSYGGRAAGWPFPTMASISSLDTLNGELHWRWSWRILPTTNYPPPRTRDPQAGCIPLLP